MRNWRQLARMSYILIERSMRIRKSESKSWSLVLLMATYILEYLQKTAIRYFVELALCTKNKNSSSSKRVGGLALKKRLYIISISKWIFMKVYRAFSGSKQIRLALSLPPDYYRTVTFLIESYCHTIFSECVCLHCNYHCKSVGCGRYTLLREIFWLNLL